MAQEGKIISIRISEKQLALISRRIKKIQQTVPEKDKLKPGTIAKYALEIYLDNLTEDDLA